MVEDKRKLNLLLRADTNREETSADNYSAKMGEVERCQLSVGVVEELGMSN